MKIVAISDTHNRHREITIPECDVLIHAGDATMLGTDKEMEDFANWLVIQPAKQIFFIPGNHEVKFYHDHIWDINAFSKINRIYCRTVVDGSYRLLNGREKLYGSPWTTVSPKWGFQFPWWEKDNETKIKRWEAIPEDVNILVTHAPPYGILDSVPNPNAKNIDKDDYLYPIVMLGTNHGDKSLKKEIQKRKNLKYHFFGHIHESYGHKEIDGVHYYNVAICDRNYDPVNPVTVVDIK